MSEQLKTQTFREFILEWLIPHEGENAYDDRTIVGYLFHEVKRISQGAFGPETVMFTLRRLENNSYILRVYGKSLTGFYVEEMATQPLFYETCRWGDDYGKRIATIWKRHNVDTREELVELKKFFEGQPNGVARCSAVYPNDPNSDTPDTKSVIEGLHTMWVRTVPDYIWLAMDETAG